MRSDFSRSFDEIENIVAFTDEFFAGKEIDESVRYVVDLCVEELFVNMVTYDTETDAEITVEMQPHEKGVRVSLTDYDVDRFDPRKTPNVNVDAPIEQREPGGLGLYLVSKMVDSIHYDYHDRTSKITFVAGRK